MAAAGSGEIDRPRRTQEWIDYSMIEGKETSAEEMIEGKETSAEEMIEGKEMSADKLAELSRYYHILTNPLEEEIMITFVNGLEIAHQYFEFREYLKRNCDFIKHDSCERDSFKRLIHQQERKTMFNKLNEALFMAAIKGHITELKHEMILEQRPKTGHIDSYDLKYREYFQGIYDDIMVKAGVSPRDLLFKLVCEARKGDYFLQKDPKAELDRIMESHSSFYNDYFIAPKFRFNPFYLERKVKVPWLPADYTKEYVKTLLSDCGEIEDVELESAELETQHAYVTFKTSESVKIAPFIMDMNETLVVRVPDDNAVVVVGREDVNVLLSNERKAKAAYARLYLRYSEPAERDRDRDRDRDEKRSKSPGASPPRSVRPRTAEETDIMDFQ